MMHKIPHKHRLRSYLQRGGIIAYPTEHCYGLGCHPKHAKALAKLLHLKQRPQHKGLIVIGDNIKQLQPLLNKLPENQIQQLANIWPAAKTFILPAHQTILPQLRGQRRQTLAVRIPDHTLARRLCQLSKTALVSTSCNKAKHKPCKTERETRRLFGHKVWVIGGQTSGNKQPSTIIDWSTGTCLR